MLGLDLQVALDLNLSLHDARHPLVVDAQGLKIYTTSKPLNLSHSLHDAKWFPLDLYRHAHHPLLNPLSSVIKDLGRAAQIRSCRVSERGSALINSCGPAREHPLPRAVERP